MKHRHHIIPRHAGGTDEPSNIIVLTIEEHAEAHRLLYEQYGKIQDYCAWQGLIENLDKEDIFIQLMKSKEIREKISKGTKKHWENLSDEEKTNKRNRFLEIRKLTTGSKGKTWKLSEESKNKQRKPKTEKHRENMKINHADFSGEKNPNYGRKHSPETLEKMRMSAIARHQKRTEGEQN